MYVIFVVARNTTQVLSGVETLQYRHLLESHEMPQKKSIFS